MTLISSCTFETFCLGGDKESCHHQSDWHEDSNSQRGVCMEVNKSYEPLSAEEERTGKAIAVHKELGPGLLERVYEVCFCHVLTDMGFNVLRQIDVPIQFEEHVFEEGLRLDVMVNNLVICELKAMDNINPV